ncbi:MAG: hypothetical protein ACWA5P_01755 [bacterium]
MRKCKITKKQIQIAEALKSTVHPSNELVFHMNKLYRELEQQKIAS